MMHEQEYIAIEYQKELEREAKRARKHEIIGREKNPYPFIRLFQPFPKQKDPVCCCAYAVSPNNL